jgi:hypothetical protein
VGGQAIGVTPLSTLLPIGTQQLSIGKLGYQVEQAFVQLDAAPASAKPVRTRVVLQPIAAPAASAAPEPPRPAPIKAIRPVPPRRAATRHADPTREEPTVSPAQPRPAVAAPVEPAPAPALVEAPARARLLDEQPRARLLE